MLDVLSRRTKKVRLTIVSCICYVQHSGKGKRSLTSNLLCYSTQQKYISGKLSGVVSERDYVTKVALLGESSEDISVKQISTKAANLVMARPYDTVDACMDKMLSRDIRHLPLIDDMGQVVGIISIKDLIKECLDEKEHTLNQLASFAVGEGGHFVM